MSESDEIVAAYEAAEAEALAGKRKMPTMTEIVREWVATRVARFSVERALADIARKEAEK